MSSKETVEEVEKQLKEAGEKLLQPPASVDELLSLLDLSEKALEEVGQSPGKSMHDALSFLRKALVSHELLGHPDTDVKVSVASCISEITRITAPEAPYDDENMKRVFQLIVSSFEDLSDKFSRSYTKRETILETLAKVRSCVIMLDLECDDLITEMFQIFFRTIRDFHPDRIFTSMATIMNLVLEESEEVSTELLTTLLSSVKRDNEEVPHIARRLGEQILETSAVKLKPYLTQAIKYSDISLDSYSKIVASVCEGTVGEDASNALLPKPTDGCKATVASIEVTHEGDGCKAAAASLEATQNGDGSKAATASSEETQLDDGNKDTVASSEETREGGHSKAAAVSCEETQEDLEVVERDCLGDKSPAAKRFPKTTVSNGTNVKSNEKTLVKGESPGKGETSETDIKSTNDEAIPKPESHVLGVEEPSVSKSKKIPKNRQKQPTSSNKSVESSDPPHVDGEKEAKMLTDIETRKDANAASPSPSAGKADENLPKRDGHQQEKECATLGEVSSLGRVTDEESERASDSGGESGESADKKVLHESPSKDETSVEVGTSKHEDSGSSDSEDTPVKAPSKKLHLLDSDDDGSLLKNSIKRARTKARSVKDALKSFPKDSVKEFVPSQNRTAKYDKAVENEGEILSKRKRSLGKGEASGSLKYGKDLIRSRVKVWWPMDKKFYKGIIVNYDSDKRKHQVVYDDGDEEMLNLKKERWQFIEDDTVSDDDADASSETPKSKKGKKSATPLVKQLDLDDISPKRLPASSTKSKGKSSRSGKMTKNDKAETKSKDGTRKSGADGIGSQPKAHSQKFSGKNVDDAPKSSGKGKDLDNSTLKSKPKQDTPKIAGKSKENTPKSGGKSKDTPKTAGKSKEDSPKTAVKSKTQGSGSKSKANGAGKEKSSLSKGKGSVQEKSSESLEGTKRKLLDSFKDEGSEAKSSKKKRRSIKG